MEILSRFHQHFTSSFYARRSQKCKKGSQRKQLFVLLGSTSIKALRKHVDEIEIWSRVTSVTTISKPSHCDALDMSLFGWTEKQTREREEERELLKERDRMKHKKRERGTDR